MIARQRGSIIYYYLSRAATGARRRREEIALGANLENALAEYAQLTGNVGDDARPVHLRPWLAKELHAACKKRAKVRGIDFALTIEDVQDLLDRSEGKCMLTGIKFSLAKVAGQRALGAEH